MPPIEYKYNSDEKIIYSCFSGGLKLKHILDHYEKLSNDDFIGQSVIELVDTSSVSYINLNPSEVARMPYNYFPVIEKYNIFGTIFYGPNKLNIPMLELIQAYFEMELPSHLFLICAGQDEALIALKKLNK